MTNQCFRARTRNPIVAFLELPASSTKQIANQTVSQDPRRSAVRRRGRFWSGVLLASVIAIAPLAPVIGASPPRPSSDAILQVEAGKRLMSLITNLRREDDISQRTVEKAMKRKMAPGQSSNVSASLVGKTKEGKVYRIELHAEPYDRRLSMLLDAHRYAENDVCLLGFRRLHQELTTRGYSASRAVAVHGLANAWTFTKGGIRIKASYLTPHYYGPGHDVVRRGLCVDTVSIN